MSQLILWFFLAQALSGFPAMQEGTRLQIVSPDLLTVHGEAVVRERQLVIQALLVPETEVKLMVSFGGNGPGAGNSGSGPSVLEIYSGVVAPDGEDILFTGDPQGPPVSLKEFLEEERDVELFILPPDEG